MNELLEGEYGRYNSFLVARENRLICEEYFYSYHAEELHPIESVTKSVTSLLVGIAIEQGKIRDVNTSLYKLLPGFPHLEDREYKNLSLYHLLTMTAGFQMNEQERMMSDDRIGYALKRELIHEPGEVFQYDGGSTEILAAVIRDATGMHADKYAAMHLFGPLGIQDYNWDAHRQNGYPLTSGSLTMTPREMLRIGLMVLNDGMWNGVQVVSSEWIRKSTSAHTESHIPGDHYGYQWWRITITSGGRDFDAIWANGWGSQFIFILPELDMVIVTTGYNYEDERSWDIFEGLKKHLYLVGNSVTSDR
jgi:CubicO group peptidase (beta-lactamase class C family)